MEPVFDPSLLDQIIRDKPAILCYFSSETCSVCKVLKPKVLELLEERFPMMSSFYVDIERSPLLSGQHRVFTIPTILVFFDGREHSRLSRNIGIGQLEEIISRPYGLMFAS
jgi:thioredoxin 1